jgi:FkbM family methyltransferase
MSTAWFAHDRIVSERFRGALAALCRSLPSFRGKGRLGEVLGTPFPRDRDAVAKLNDGSLMKLDLNVRIQRLMYWIGNYDAPMVERFVAGLEPGCVALDIGANVGLYTIPLARKAKEVGGRAVVVEAMPANAARLRENLSLNDVLDVTTVIEAAVGQKRGCLFMHPEQDAQYTGNASAASNPDGAIEVPVVTLDEIAIELGLDRCDLVKADIEGGELDFLRGGASFLARHTPLLVFELNSAHMRRAGWTADDLRALLRHWGYGEYEGGGSAAISTLVARPRPDALPATTREDHSVPGPRGDTPD